MATTIDSLQLEIQSNSTSAASGIDGLAKALKKLKKNSDINDAVTSLNNLRKALHAFVNMPSNASKIDSLARSLKSLSKVGKINIGDSLASVKRSMESLGAINVDSVAPQIERIAGALSPLNGMNGSGFNNMMNGLKKLGDVADSLDDATITRFVTQVKRLDAELGPLSTKMTDVASAFRAVDSSALKAGDGVKSFRTHISAAAMNLTNYIDVARNAYASLQPVINLFKNTMSQAIEWEGISARFGRGFGDQAEEIYSWIQRLNQEMGINTQQFMQYSSVFSTMLQGFGVNSGDSSKMALGYTELVYDIWAGYNDVYKNFADAAEAVKSAIAGEVEPIRRAGFTIVESTLQQTAANHGLEISLEKATEAEKSYLRYLTLVDQAHSQNLVGTYASELDTAEGMVRTLAQQTKSLAQTFGSLFLPVLMKIMPWIQAFVSLINDAIVAVANFFGVTIQLASFGKAKSGIDGVAKSAGAAGGALGSAAKAAKELKNATIGIDELNVISPPDDTGGGGGGAGGGAGAYDWDVDSLWNESIFEQIESQVGAIKEKIKGLITVVSGIGVALAGWSVLKFLDDLDDADIKLKKLEPTLKNIGKGLVIAGVSVAVGKLVWDFTGAYLEGGNKADLLKALGTTALGVALAGFLAGAPGAGIVLAVSGIVSLSRLLVELKEASVEISDPEAITTGIVGAIQTVIGGAITWKALGPTITGAIKGLLGSASLAKIGTTIGGALSTGWSAITGAMAAIPVWGWIAAAVVALLGGAIGLAVADYDFTDVGRKVGEGIGKACRWLADKKEAVDKWAKDVDAAITDAMNAAIKYFTEDFSWDKLFQDMLDGLIAVEQWKNDFIAAGRDIVDGIIVGIEEKWDNFCGNIGEFWTGLTEGFKEAFGIHSPAKKVMFIGQSILDGVLYYLTPDGLKDKLVTMWNNASDWWNKKKEFKKYTPTIGDIKAEVSDAWTTAKNWWDETKDELEMYTPSIGDIKEELSNAWDTAKNWWERSKAKLSTYTPSIGSIRDKLSAAWTTAKTWWNETKGNLATYTPSIGSIKDKLSSAWSTAKEWWDNSRSALSNVSVAVSSIQSKLQSAWATAKDWWDRNVRLSIPSLSFKVEYNTKNLGSIQKAIVNALNLPGWPKLSFAKDGGMFDMGSLIWAGEAGAEVVANAGGGRTGVMNVQQMQEAVYEGVYSAVVSAMQANAGDGGQSVNVYLDGKQITAAVEKRQRERGASLMTGGMAYGF